MAQTQYKMRKAEARERLPEINLLPKIDHEERQLDLARFGPNTYQVNKEGMGQQYFHSKSLPVISFRPATTAESISAVAYDFKSVAKPQIFDPNWFQAGDIVRTPEGVFANTTITDTKSLKEILANSKQVNGIWLYNGNDSSLKDVGFAPYDSFTRGFQDCDTFAQGGLARVLEHTSGKEAQNLRLIASPKLYNRGVDVWGFDDVKEPVLRVAGLNSNRDIDDYRLDVDGSWGGDGNDGFAFGVLDTSAEGASQKR